MLPTLQGSLFDALFVGHSSCAAGGDDCGALKRTFVQLVMSYMAVSIVKGLLTGGQELCFELLGPRLVTRVQSLVFSTTVLQDIAFFDGVRAGDLISRLDRDVYYMVRPLEHTLSSSLSGLITLAGGGLMCFVTSWRLSMLAFVTVLPMGFVTHAYATWSGRINREIVQHYSDATAVAHEALGNIRTVRSVSSEEAEVEKHRTSLEHALRKGVRDAVYGSLATSFNSHLELGSSVMMLWCGGLIAMSEAGEPITVGDLIKFQLYCNLMNSALGSLNDVFSSLAKSAGAAERVLSLLDLRPDIPHASGLDVQHSIARWDVRFEAVVFRYQMRPATAVLRGLSFQVDEGSVTALVGRSGGGKSTVIHLLLRYYDPSAGRISLGGVDLRTLSLRSVHRATGLVSQDTQLFNATLRENIGYGTPSFTQDELEAAARAAQAHEFISSFEDGYLTRVGDRGQRLSGGQRQRIAIARCLLRKPRLLLLDEATSALDTESEGLVQKALDGLIRSGDRTAVILVAHRLSTVVNASQILMIDDGVAVERGTHEQLLAARGAYASLVENQLQLQKQNVDGGGS